MRSRITVAACIVIAAAALAAVGLSAGSSAAAGFGDADLAGIRAATARYHDIERARRDGYEQVSACAELPGVGAMGVHFINEQLAADTTVDPQHPELLVYEPQRDGSLRLVSVEWFVADADQDLATDDDRPSLLGHRFDGPMLGHEPGMPIHFDLHAYVWRHNPSGMFAAWNPRVHCP
jgi:hypothetical protein